MEEELRKVEHKGKKPDAKKTQAMRERRLQEILSGKRVKRFADPAMLLEGDSDG